MTTLLFSFPEQDGFAGQLLAESGQLHANGWRSGEMEMRRFPDGESYIRIDSDVRDIDVAILCQLHQPDGKLMPLLLLADTLRDLGARRIGLIAPYLAYMRQDKRFQAGEGVTSHYVARLLSQHLDWMLTVDPHLHRISNLQEIYTIPARSVTAVEPIADWIKANIHQPLVIGPDSESEQWAASVAELAGCPWEVLQKTRFGDRSVAVSLPHVDNYRNHTPVLVDDIISTGKTMIQTAAHLQAAGLCAPVCIAVHGIFADGALADMQYHGLQVVTSNSIADPSNKIDLAPLISRALLEN
ncbi:ribose-phosphate pyrophosphokinase [Pseudohongiella sp.]|uniref:Phosphoribosyl pyrophosphate synthase n=1 Tax=marine sediment metagenome TaxID=412755 RepID=A0A0F9YAK2_9ZZZZ|nr:ribose-phosphate pyrophosphokinase [Pseudohongiella sp.]HDZ07900.1 ribose-phosphate pyrophosphokinase [Pseudohongiella sp.]HEA64493.1 ribose-phosphate pyrophosphokinase [Pseudohongiella sp.]